jgi:hypothetical protein
MSDNAQRIAANCQKVIDRIAAAAASAGRSAEEITLVAVTKYVDAERAAALLAAGCRALGESRPQSLWEKADEPALAGAEWHLIGHLQRNKIRRTLPFCALIHSVDSERLLDSIEQSAAELDLVCKVLLEVNISGDVAKHGLRPEELPALVARREDWPHIDVRGLMGMASREGGAATAQRNFAELRTLRDALGRAAALPELSMGMSGDFEAAIAEGATIVRVGSALFEGVSP